MSDLEDQIQSVVEENIQEDPEHLRIPVFSPSIPNHLLNECNEQQKFILERISVLIQQNKWQMEKLKDIEEKRIDSDDKFSTLFTFKTKADLKEARDSGSKQWKKYCFILVGFVGYPLYLATAEKMGLTQILKWFTF